MKICSRRGRVNTPSPDPQADGDADNSRGVVLILNAGGRRPLIRWFTARSLVERYLATDRDTDDIIGISTALFELEVSVHDTRADARRVTAAVKQKFALACVSASGAA
jgi:hypothetical protein